MNLSNKLTFSFLFTVLLLSAMVMVPTVMAQTIEAERADDLVDGNVTGAGWKVTLSGLSDHATDANDAPTVTYLNVNGTAAAAAGTQDGFAAVADAATTSTGEIAAAIGDVIAVQVSITGGTVTTARLYQRVTFPAAGPGATVPSTNLVRIPKLAKLTTSQYYASFNEMVTITFNFAAAGMTNGAPMAPLHISDLTNTDGTTAFNGTGWQVESVSGTSMVTLRSTLTRSAASATVTATLRSAYAQPTGESGGTPPASDGHAMVTYDDTPPTVTTGSVGLAAPPGFPTPPDGVWNSTFLLTFSVDDIATDTSGSDLPDTNPVSIMTDRTKLDVGTVGLGTANDSFAGTEYLVRITPKADRVTSAGEEVVITIVPIDKAGNEGGFLLL